MLIKMINYKVFELVFYVKIKFDTVNIFATLMSK